MKFSELNKKLNKIIEIIIIGNAKKLIFLFLKNDAIRAGIELRCDKKDKIAIFLYLFLFKL
jgi:hypothetical protein